MKTCSKFDQDFEVANAAIADYIDCLAEKMPNEMVALVLLRNMRGLFGDITDFDQWELLKNDILDIRDEFMNEVEPHLSGVIDPDLEAENYNKRYA